MHLTVEEILALARTPGAFCIDAPAHPVTDVRFWYETTVEANGKIPGPSGRTLRQPLPAQALPRQALPGSNCGAESAAAGSAVDARRPAQRESQADAASGERRSGGTYQRPAAATLWRYREECFAGADDRRRSPIDQASPNRRSSGPEHAHRNVLVGPTRRRPSAPSVLSAMPHGPTTSGSAA